jgi:serine/threonine-protein kinase TTK/MPS1
MVYGRTPFQHIGNQLAKIHAISSEQHVIEYPKKGKGRDRMLVDVIKVLKILNEQKYQKN